MTTSFNNQSSFELVLELNITTRVLKFEGLNDGLNSDYQFQIDFLSFIKLYPQKILNSKASLIRHSKNKKTYMHGVITEVKYLGKADSKYHYEIKLSSPLHKLKQQIKNRAFHYKKATQIIEQILLEASWKANHFKIQIEKNNPIVSYLTQYNESDFYLIERLCIQYGWIYYFIHDVHQVILYFTDRYPEKFPISLSYLPNTELKLDQIGVTHIKQFVSLLPQSILLKTYHLNSPDTDLSIQTTSSSPLKSSSILEIYGLDYETRTEGQLLANVIQQQLDWQREVTVIITEENGLCAGDILEITGCPKSFLNKQYRILTLMHYGFEALGERNGRYHNRAILIPANIFYCKPCSYTRMPHYLWCDSEKPYPQIVASILINQNHLPHLLPGRLKKQIRHAKEIDSEGFYVAKIHFSENQNEKNQQEYPIQCLQPYGGQQSMEHHDYGFHFPFKENTEVAINHLHGYIPLMIGAFPNFNALTPVNHQNPWQNILRTKGNQEICLQDLSNQEMMIFSTEHKDQEIILCAEKENAGVYFQCQQGEIEIRVAGASVSTAGRDHKVEAGSQTIVVQDNYHVLTELGTIEHESGKQIKLQAKQDILNRNQENFKAETQHDFSVASKKNFFFVTRLGNSHICSQKGDIHFKSQRALSLQSDQSFDLSTSGASIRIHASMGMILEAHAITFSAPNIGIH